MPVGYTRDANGQFRAWVRVSSRRDEFNELETKRFPARTRPAVIQNWRTEARRRLRLQLEDHRQRRRAVRGDPGTFRADAVRYLNAVRALTTFRERCRHISLWVDEFGDRPRAEIAAHEIRTVRDRWLTSGPKRVWKKVNGVGQFVDVPGPLAASTVNHRLRALSNLYAVLDGRQAPNPVRDDVPEADEPLGVPRALDYQTIRAILAAMSDQGQAFAATGDKKAYRNDYSLSKLRARVMAWTGVTPKELAKIEARDVYWDDRFLLVPARRKGRGAPGRIVPLGPEAFEALTDFNHRNAYGAFRSRVVLRAWQRACRQVIGRSVRLYDLRHSFVTAVVHATKNLGTAQLLAGHTDERTTRRYAMAAVLPTLRAGIDAFTTSVTPSKKGPS